MYALMSLGGVLSYYARGAEKVKDLSFSSVVSSLVSILCNIYFLVVLDAGLLGYFYASIIGSAVQCAYLLVSTRPLKEHRLKRTDRQLEKDMVSYSSPMIANAISWWINNASDRYIVTWLCGVAANGVYAVSYKIPSIISVLQQIFGQAWTISAVKDFDKDDKDGFYIKVYDLYDAVLVLACSLLIFLDKPLAKFLFANDFYSAWTYAPFLMISTVFSGMAAFVGGLFSALKKSKSFAETSVASAAINTIGNLVLVPILGPFGASISTAVGYFVMLVMRLRTISKDVELAVNYKRDFLSYGLLVLQALLLCFDGITSAFSWYQLLFVVIEFFLFRKQIGSFVYKTKSMVTRD